MENQTQTKTTLTLESVRPHSQTLSARFSNLDALYAKIKPETLQQIAGKSSFQYGATLLQAIHNKRAHQKPIVLPLSSLIDSLRDHSAIIEKDWNAKWYIKSWHDLRRALCFSVNQKDGEEISANNILFELDSKIDKLPKIDDARKAQIRANEIDDLDKAYGSYEIEIKFS